MKIRKKRFAIVFMTICVIISSLLSLYLFLPNLHVEQWQGESYYREEAYLSFGFGFNRYGKVASQYLPQYKTLSTQAKEIEFIYQDGGIYFHNVVCVCINVVYEEQNHYISARDNVLQSGEHFGYDRRAINNEYRNYVLINKERRMNGEYCYYIASCCDRDCSVMYLVLFDSHNHESALFLEDYTNFFDDYWKILHPLCASDKT